MPSRRNSVVDVLIVGAGITGLTAAVEASRLGLSVHIVDRKNRRFRQDNKALLTNVRTLELLYALGDGRITKQLLDSAKCIDSLSVQLGKDQNRIAVRVGKGKYGACGSKTLLSLPRALTETILEKELHEEYGVKVEWNTNLDGILQKDGKVESILERENGLQDSMLSRFVIGCDGARSTVRETVDIQMRHTKSKMHLIVADIEINNHGLDKSQLSLFLHSSGMLALYPSHKENHFRLVGPAPPGFTEQCDNDLDSKYLSKILSDRTGVDLSCQVGKFATVAEVTQGVSATFRRRRVFLAGDASHAHSPVGGQGINCGVQDAFNLMWKLAWVERCRKKAGCDFFDDTVQAILDSYDLERRTLANKTLQDVERTTFLMSTKNKLVQKMRNVVMRIIGKRLLHAKIRNMRQQSVKYDAASSTIISEQSQSNFICKPGERLPNLLLDDGQWLYGHISRSRHTWVVLCLEGDDTGIRSSNQGFKENLNQIYVVPNKNQGCLPSTMDQAALRRPQAILVRPDLHVAAIDGSLEKTWVQAKKLLGERAMTEM